MALIKINNFREDDEHQVNTVELMASWQLWLASSAQFVHLDSGSNSLYIEQGAYFALKSPFRWYRIVEETFTISQANIDVGGNFKANTWYHLFLVDDGGDGALLLSEHDAYPLGSNRTDSLWVAQFKTQDNGIIEGSTVVDIQSSKLGESLPIGNIYVQYPSERSPEELFPRQRWQNVSASFAGDFFRVEGSLANSFGSGRQQPSLPKPTATTTVSQPTATTTVSQPTATTTVTKPTATTTVSQPNASLNSNVGMSLGLSKGGGTGGNTGCENAWLNMGKSAITVSQPTATTTVSQPTATTTVTKPTATTTVSQPTATTTIATANGYGERNEVAPQNQTIRLWRKMGTVIGSETFAVVDAQNIFIETLELAQDEAGYIGFNPNIHIQMLPSKTMLNKRSAEKKLYFNRASQRWQEQQNGLAPNTTQEASMLTQTSQETTLQTKRPKTKESNPRANKKSKEK